jgi:hypothetical protein
MADYPVPGGEVDARTTITIEVEWSRLPVIVEKRANGGCQMHAEGPVYMQTHFDVQCNGCHERAPTNYRNRQRRVCRSKSRTGALRSALAAESLEVS